MPMHQKYVASGKPAYDAIAAERRAAYPPVLTPMPCHGCSQKTSADDFWVCRWVYYFSKLGLASMLATIIGKVFLSSAVVPHVTYHWICPSCARATKTQRLLAGLVQFVGLFITILGLGGTMVMLAALFAVKLAPSDRKFVLTWAWLPIAMLIFGTAITATWRLFRYPGALGELNRKPFFLEGFFKSNTSKLDELQRDYPDLYGFDLPSRSPA